MKYRIERGASGWQIGERKEVKSGDNKGNVSYVAFRFHATLERAALDLLDILIHDKADTADTAALIDAVHEAQSETKRVLVECLTK